VSNDKYTGYPGDSDRTIFIPKPGGRRPAVPVPPKPPPAPQSFNDYAEQPEIIPAGVNPLVSAASELVALPAQLLNMISHQDVAGLRRQVLEEIKTFENKARLMGISPEITYTSRYVLCAFIDEAVLNTIWGSNSLWNSQSLLSSLHNETSGGEKFFIILDNLLRDPNANLDLLELMFLCISLGFKGQYAVMDRGPEKLEELRNVVFEHIRRRRGEFPQELSPHWQSQTGQRTTLRNYIPLWVVIAVAGAILFAIFVGFTMVLDETADPVYETLQSIGKTPTMDVQKDN
jgi:type VI secretion system protein ImpK